MAEFSNNRKLGNRSTDFVSVKDFGAVGDGVTDDTAAIQAAIDYASGLGGFQRKVVWFPAGDYQITELTWATEVSLIGEDWRNTRLTGTGGAGTKMIKAPSGSFGGAIQVLSGFSFIPDGVQVVNGIDLTDASNVNGCYFDKLWFNNCDDCMTIGNTSGGKGFGDIWIGDIVVEQSNNGLIMENGDDLILGSLLGTRLDEFGVKFDTVKKSMLGPIRLVEAGGATSSNAAMRFASCDRITSSQSIIRQLSVSASPSYTLAVISACTRMKFDNFEWGGESGSNNDTEEGLKIIGVCDDLKFSNGTIKDVIEIDTGHGIEVGDGTNAVTNCVFNNVHTETTGGNGWTQAANADLEMIGCSTSNPMVGSVAGTRAGWDFTSGGNTTVIGGKVSGSNITAGHGINCTNNDEKKLIGIRADDGITATGDVRVFVSDCDTGGNGNLAQTVTSTINPGGIAAGAEYSTTVTLTGAKTQDAVLWSAGTGTLDELQVTVHVSGNDTVAIEIHNPTAGTITPASATWTFKLVKLS